MRIMAALLFAFMLTGCTGDRLRARTKCDEVSAVMSNPSATRDQVASAMEMGRSNRCFGT
jgi:outer membrane murein-binding lipoprotein Lpp